MEIWNSIKFGPQFLRFAIGTIGPSGTLQGQSNFKVPKLVFNLDLFFFKMYCLP